MRIQARVYELELEVPFAIARGTTAKHAIAIAEIEWNGVRGYGEASPSAYYGDSVEKAIEAIEGASEILGDDPFAIERIDRDLRQAFPESPSGRGAVEIALYDLVGKIMGQPLYRILGLAGIDPPMSSYTVGVEDVATAERLIGKLNEFPILKVKLGFGDELGLLELVSKRTRARLRVDANEGWQVAEAIEKINAYSKRFGIEFFEQPLPKTDLEGYRELRRATDATIIVDESVTSCQDVIRWAQIVHGINIKLMKSGGIVEALRMITAARASGLRVMLGCMVESSIGITAAAHIAPLVDFCDLDGNLLITNDPFHGVKASRGRLTLPSAPGLGVEPVA